MFERIVVGILIGFVAGVFESGLLPFSQNTQQITVGVLMLAAIAFVVASFMFGAIFGVMAIAEIAVGYYASSKLFGPQSAKL